MEDQEEIREDSYNVHLHITVDKSVYWHPVSDSAVLDDLQEHITDAIEDIGGIAVMSFDAEREKE
jgi:hypothetical protein